MTVRFADAEPNGLADLVGRLIDANLQAEPGRRELLADTVVRLKASDAAIEATVTLSVDGVSVANGPPAGRRPHLVLSADAYDLIELAGAPLRFGFPDLFDARGRSVLGRIANRHVRVSGMLRHPVRLSRFTRLLSVVP
ncbi:MAG TPA: hypothetical protein VFP13_09655 [Actinomycetota bacterium]|nr:hypothetical protein [Actinomycetota bacterium]